MTTTVIDSLELDMHEIIVLVRGDIDKVQRLRNALQVDAAFEAGMCQVELLGVFAPTIMEREENV